MKALILLFIVALVFCSQSSVIVDCKVSEERIYDYISVIHSFGGTDKSSGKRKDDVNSQDGQKSTVTAQVGITCIKAFPFKRQGNNLYLMHMRIRNVNMNMTLDNEEQWNKRKIKPSNGTPNYDSLFGEFTAFTMSDKGKIYKVFHAKKEDSWVTAMKKSIIAQLQVKYGNTERVEKDGVGAHVAHYKTKPQNDGSLVIKKKFTDADIPKENSKAKRKQMRLTSEAESVVDKQGNIQAVLKHEKLVFGTHHHKHSHPGFFSLRNVPYKDSSHFGTGHDMWLNADEQTQLIFVKSAPFAGSVDKHVKRNKADNEVMSSHEEFELHDEIVQSDLSVGEEVLRDLSRKTRKELLHAQYNAEELLDTLTENPDDVIASSILSEFVELDESIVDAVHHRFQNVSKKHGLSHHFLRAAQSLLASANSTKAQEYLLKTLKSADLVMHAILKAANVEKPIPAILEVIEHYAKEVSNHSFGESVEKNAMPLNAFLILASLANKVPEDKKKSIIDRIVGEMQNATCIAKVLYYVHAMGNAGSAAPLYPLKKIIFDKTTPLPVRLAAVEALRKRADAEEDEQVTNLIHRIVSKRRCHPLVKLAAIKAQTQREEHLANGASVNFFKKYLLNKRTPSLLKKAIVDYYDTHGSDEAGEILLMSNVEEFLNDEDEDFEEFDDRVEALTDAMFLKKVGGFFKRVGQGIGNAVKKVGEGVKNVVKKVGEGVKKVVDGVANAGKKIKDTFNSIKNAFAKATFENNQVCVPASKKPGDQICVYDQDMANFLASQGDMSNHNLAAHFSFEKLIGANKLNLYVGALGVAGTNFNCAEPPSTFEFVVAGRMEAKAQVFNKKYTLILAHLTARQKDNQYYDKIYVRILDNVVLDQGLLPVDKIKLCNEYKKPIYNKDFNNLPGLDMTIMLGPIPITFGFKIVANARIDAVASYCFNDLTAKAGIQPGVSVGISGHAGIGLFIAKAGIRVEASLNYAVQPNVNARGLQCKICANLDQVVTPMSVNIRAFADVDIKIFKWNGDFTLFKWDMPAEIKPLFQRCLDIPRLFRPNNQTPASNGRNLAGPTARPQVAAPAQRFNSRRIALNDEIASDE